MDLRLLLKEYTEAKANADRWDKIANKLNMQIKELMAKQDVNELVEGNYKFERKITYRKNVNEDRLLNLLKNNGHSNLIKMVEKVDEDELERALVDGLVIMDDFESCIDKKEIVSLKISMLKDKKEGIN